MSIKFSGSQRMGLDDHPTRFEIVERKSEEQQLEADPTLTFPHCFLL